MTVDELEDVLALFTQTSQHLQSVLVGERCIDCTCYRDPPFDVAVHVCMYVCMYVYVCMHMYVYVCMYVLYVCTCVCVMCDILKVPPI